MWFAMWETMWLKCGDHHLTMSLSPSLPPLWNPRKLSFLAISIVRKGTRATVSEQHFLGVAAFLISKEFPQDQCGIHLH